VRGTFDWGVLDEKRTHPNTNIERSKWDFGPTSVILCHNCIGAVDYVETKCVLKAKLLSVPKRTRARYEQYALKLLSSRRIYSRLFLHRNSCIFKADVIWPRSRALQTANRSVLFVT
jgi:hypothetical protein